MRAAPYASLPLTYTRDNGTCWLCHTAVPAPGTIHPLHPKAPTKDHIIPRSRIGRNPTVRAYMDHPVNVALAHRACNCERNNPIPTPNQVPWDRIRPGEEDAARAIYGRFTAWWNSGPGIPPQIHEFLRGGSLPTNLYPSAAI